MATLTHDDKYACAFDLTLSEWERYSAEKGDSNIETVPLEGFALLLSFLNSREIWQCQK